MAKKMRAQKNMKRILSFGLWSLAIAGLLAIVLILGYTVHNHSGHTAWEPFCSFLLFLPAALAGVGSLVLQKKWPGIKRPGAAAFIVGTIGMLLIIYLDQSNSLVQYERWVQRGMP